MSKKNKKNKNNKNYEDIVIFNYENIKDYDIDNIELLSFKKKILKGSFQIANDSKLLFDYNYQVKVFSKKQKAYQSHNHYRHCK